MGKSLRIIYFFCFLITSLAGWAQTRYNMSNNTVNECKGILVDSENAKPPNDATWYGLGEDFCFTIHIQNSPKITLNFTFFELEPLGPTGDIFDYLTIYDGPSSSSPLIGKWSDSISPGTISSTGDYITICFHSDNNKSAPGFELFWDATPPPPTPPAIQSIPNVSCNSTSVTISFDQPIPCSQLTAANFTAAGPSGSSVSSVTPINCQNGFATSAILNFNSQLNQSGTYCLDFNFVFVDICGKSYRFTISQCFNIIDCPLVVAINGNPTVCNGSCVSLTANVQGGNPANYQYLWTPGNLTTATVSVCPTADQTYTLRVTDGTSQPATSTHFVRVLPVPDAGLDTAICRFGPDFNLVGTPPGGTWTGSGILNAPSASGTFRPSSTPGNGGVFSVVYSQGGCTDIRQITVHPVSAGPRRPVCLNSAAFQVNGTPTGGTWTGTGVTTTGQYTPNTAGVYTLTYTEPLQGCTATTIIEVVDSIVVADTSTIMACDNQAPFNMTCTPIGGQWTGTGITNGGLGTFNPAVAGLGVHKLFYAITGCRDSTDVTVNVINAGVDTLVCPSNSSYLLTSGTPAGGTWAGPGIVDNLDGTYNFNPALVTPDTIFFLKYTVAACTDSLRMFLLNTTITNQQLSFCAYDQTTWLDPAFTTPNIPGGVWSGAGLVSPDSINPKLLNPGISYLFYEYNNNGCRDSLRIQVKVKPNAGPDFTTCPVANDFNLVGNPAGGIWSGTGIIDANAGTFSPITAGGGQPTVVDVYYTIAGCVDTVTITLDRVNPTFFGLSSYYCLNNVPVNLTGSPTGGVFSGPGINGNTFNPILAGSGIHTITYTFGNGACAEDTTKTVKVLNPIDFDFIYPPATLCFGDSVLIRIIKSGGDSTKVFHYSWNPDKGDRNFNYIKPTTLTTFSLTVTDNCSQPVTKSASIDVFPQIVYDSITGPPLCYEDTNWAKVNVYTNPRADFILIWNIPAPNITDSVNLPGGTYKCKILNTKTGCSVTTKVKIPYYPKVTANFFKTPFDDCITVDDPNFNFIDLSTGVDSGQGYWDLGDTILLYDPYVNPSRTYKDTGRFHIKLFVSNTIGCSDSLETDICILPVEQYVMPNAFTPGSDGNNDVFPMGDWVNGKYLPTSYGLTDYDMIIMDRWGHLMYETDAYKSPWNGRLFNTGNLQKSGVYVYKMTLYFGERDIRVQSGKVILLR